MVHRVLIPLLLLTVFFSIAITVDRAKGYDFPIWTFCRLSPQGPPADILFIGSSRIRASFNETFIEQHAKATTGESLSVHMISSASTDLILYNALSRKYVAEKGAPKHVFIEAMHTTRKNIAFFDAHQNRSMSPYVSNVGAAFLPLRYYREILAEEPFSSPFQRIHPEHTNLIELAATQYVASFYRFLQEPKTSITDRNDGCRKLEPSIQEKETEYQDILKKWDEPPLLVDDELRKTHTFSGTMQNVAPRAPLSSERRYENSAMKSLIHVFRKAGVENIYVVVMASFEEDEVTEDIRKAYKELFPGASIVFSADFYNEHEDLALMYIDRFHYSATASILISNEYLNIVRQNND